MADDNLILSDTVKAWADIVLKVWEDKMSKYRVNSSYSLVNSLLFHVVTAANGDPVLVNFFFNYYGRFVDMGVGKGKPLNSTASITVTRKAKPWYNKAFYSQVMKLNEIYCKKYANKAALVIVESIN